MKFLTEQIKEDIIKGGLVIAPSCSGKTTAIIELLKFSQYLMVVRDENEKLYYEIKHPELKGKFIIPEQAMDMFVHNFKLIVDECFTNRCFHDTSKFWWAAVGCNDYDVKLYTNNNTLKLEAATTWVIR